MPSLPIAEEALLIGGESVPLQFRQSARARRYVLSLRHEGVLRVTIPRRGSMSEARRFIEEKRPWIGRVWERWQTQSLEAVRKRWTHGSEVLFRGEKQMVSIEAEAHWRVCLGDLTCGPLEAPDADARPLIERVLQRLAATELPPRVFELAIQHQCPVRRVTVRNQRTRWGSCSRRGTISLNWRLIQVPVAVRDYIILHELMHLREMNHSRRFWTHVEKVCPDYRSAERWLKQHGRVLGL